MAITLDISGTKIHEGDTKTLTLTPKDADGNSITPSALTANFTKPGGDTDSYALGDFSEDSGAYSVQHTFDTPGYWKLEVEATDSSGNVEGDGDGSIRVHQRT